MARGSIRKRGNVYYAYWRDPQGKQHAKSIGTRKKDAEAFITASRPNLPTAPIARSRRSPSPTSPNTGLRTMLPCR